VNPYAPSSYSSLSALTQESPENNVPEKYDFNLYVYSVISARGSRMSGIQTFFTVLFVLVLILAATYGALYLRAQLIRKKRREMRRRQIKINK